MPEGPSIVILKEVAEQFSGHKISSATGNTSIDTDRIVNKKIIDFKTWGKHFLICFDDFTIRIHLLMFGTYRINERKESPVRLGLTFSNGELNFYTCSVKYLEGKINMHYDFTSDVMNDKWSPKKAFAKLREKPNMMICDALLEQEIFSGVGNIIKNEILYRTKIQPEALNGNITDKKLKKLIKEARIYSFEFLKWKKNNELKSHWKAHTKKTCERCNLPLIKKHTGTKKRRSFYCDNCQKLYS